MADTPAWLSEYPEVQDDSWLNQYKEVGETPFLDLSETASSLGRAVTSLPTTTMASLSQAWEGLENPWKRSEGYLSRRQEMQALQDELAASEAEAAASGDASTVSSAIRAATPSLGGSFSTLGPSIAAGAGTLALSKSPAAARGAAAATSALMAYRMAGAQFLDDAKERIDAYFQENVGRAPNEQEQAEAYQELLPLARKFGAAEAGPEALGNLALGGAGKYIRRALGGKGGIIDLASNALGKVTGTKAALAGAGALASEVGTEGVTKVEQDRIQKQFEEGIMRGESPESVQLAERAPTDYLEGFKEVAPVTIATVGMMGAAGLGPKAISRGIQALRPKPPVEQIVEEPSMPDPAEVAKTIGDASVEQLADTGNEASAAAQADFNAILAEKLGETPESTIQPEQAAEEAGVEVKPLSEGAVSTGAGLNLESALIAKQERESSGGTTGAWKPVAEDEPPVQSGFVRFYHAGDPVISKGDRRWLSPDRAWVSGFRPGLPVSFVDVPVSDPQLKKSFDDSGTPMSSPFVNFEADEQTTAKLQPLSAGLQAAIPQQPAETQEDAIQEQSTGSLLQYPQEEAGEAGSGRERVEQSLEGQETPEARQAQEEVITLPGKPTTATEGMVTPGGVATGRDLTKPEQMNPDELPNADAFTVEQIQQSAAFEKDSEGQRMVGYGIRPKGMKVGLSPIQREQGSLINAAFEKKRPVSAAAVDTYGIKLPKGYVKQGELYIFQPQTKQAAEKQTPVPLREGTGAAGVVQSEPVEGSIPTVEKVSTETESESSGNLSTAEAAMSYLMDDLTDAQKSKWTPEMFAAAKAYFDGGGKDFESLQKVVKFPRVVSQAYLKADKAASEEQARIDRAQRATDAEIAKAEREEKKLEAEMLKREEMRSKAIDSIIGASEKKKRKFGQVTNSDAIAAVAMLVSSKDVPGVLTTWTGTKDEFLRDPANQTADPEIYARIKAGELVEGFFNKGRAYVFLDGIGVSDEDMLRGEQMSVTPQVAAVRRVLLHESLVHRGIHGLPLRHRRLILNWVRQNSTPAELDDLAKLYTEYANWRNSDYDFEALAEEFLAKKVDSLTEIPKDGPMAKLMDILRQIWDFIVGYKREPTLSDLKSVVKLLKSGAEALANDRLKDGGEVKLSMIAPTAGITPEMDAEYLAAVEAGDMEKAQRMVDEAARMAGGVEVWHGGNIEGSIIDVNRRERGAVSERRSGTFFASSNKDVARTYPGKTNRMFFFLKNPFRISTPSLRPAQWTGETAVRTAKGIESRKSSLSIGEAIDRAKDNGYDGVVYGNILDLGRNQFGVPFVGDTYVAFSPDQIKSADPVTRDESGNVIPLSQRFQTTSPDIRFSRPQFSSETSASLTAGREAARSTLYSERDMDIREAIRRAYEAMPKQNSVAVPIGELFAKTEELMPGVTQEEFSLVLQDLFEDNGAVLQEGEVVEPLTEQDRRYLALAEDEEANREELQRMVDEAAFKARKGRLRQTNYGYNLYLDGKKHSGPYESEDQAMYRAWFALGKPEAVARDDQGRIIPLSRRFDTGADIRGQINVTTPEGKRAGFVVVMPRAAKASRIKAEDATEAAKTFQTDIIEAGKGRIDTASYQGNTLKSTEAPDHNVNAPELYKDAAISLVDSLLKKHSITDIANSFQDPEFRVAVGLLGNKAINPNVAQQADLFTGAEIQSRLEKALRDEGDPAKKRIIEKTLKNHKAYYTTATGIGQNLNAVGALQQDPRFKWMFMFNEAEKEMADKGKDKLDTITGGGTQPVTDMVNQSEEAATDEATNEMTSDAEEDQDAIDLAAGEETLDERLKRLYEELKDWLRTKGAIVRARAARKSANAAKASLSKEQRDAIMQMSDEELDALEKKADENIERILNAILGKESDAKTPEQKKTRTKRKKMVDTAKKRAEAGKSIDISDTESVVKIVLREMGKARPGKQVPLTKLMPWRDILSQKAKTVEEYRQRILDAMMASEAFKEVSDEDKAKVADIFAKQWDKKRTDILDRMLEREIERKRKEGSLSEAAAKALQKSRNKIIELANLGGFDNDDLMKVLGEKFGIKTGFSEAEKARISELADKLQDETLNPAKRNKLAMEFAVTLAGASEIPVAEIIANWWTSSVLFGPQTIFSIGAAFVNGAYSITTIGTRRMLADLTRGDVKGAIEESILMLQGIAKYLGAFKQAGRRAWSYLWTGNVDVLGAAANDILGEINSLEELKRFKRHKLLAENLAKDPRALRRYVGMYLRFVNRLLTSLDAFNVMVTKAGTASLALRMSGMSTENIIKAEKMLNLKAYKDQVIRDYFDNKAPTTQAEKALVDSYAEAEMYRAVDQLGGKMENADYLASEAAMTMNPTGLGGFFYRSITGLDSKMKKAAEDYLEKAKKDWTTEKDLESALFLGLAYLRQFAVQNLGGVAGYKFIRFASNKFNQGISYLPMVGLLRTLEAKGDDIKGKEAFIETIHRNQVIGAVLTLAAIAVVKAIEEEPDDEKRGNFWNGGWENLTPDQKKQMLAKGQKEYTMGFKFNGRWYVFNYQNWPLNQVLAAIGSMSDQIRFSPKQWKEKGSLSKPLAGIVSGLKSTLEIPALSQLGELAGNRLASKDPTEQTVDRLSRVAAGWVGGFVPRILKDLDFATQPETRKYKTLWEKTASHIPIYRRYVGEEYYDILGQPIKRNVIPGSREFMMGPTEPEYKILGALNSRNIFLTPANAEYRMVGKGRNRRRLTQEEADAYSLETGKGYRQMLLRYGQRALQMPTERARAFLSDKADEVRDRALKKVYRR